MSDSMQKLLDLVLDNRFQKLGQINKSHSFFDVVGRTHTETWHSMLLGWILDPSASHGLGLFALKRLLQACVSKTESSKIEITKLLTASNIEITLQFPSEKSPKEYDVKGVGRFDGFIQLNYDDKKATIFLEQKVTDLVKIEQCEKYLKYLEENYSDQLVIPVFICHESSYNVSSERTFGSSKWNHLSYQDIYDYILTPILDIQDLNDKTKVLVTEYIKTLKKTFNGRKFIMTNEEKELAMKLYEDNQETFAIIQELLKDENPELDITPSENETLGLTINVDGKTVSGDIVKNFYNAVFNHIIESKKLDHLKNLLPISTSNVRYLVSSEPKHPSGKDFFSPIAVGGLAIETHTSRASALRYMTKLLRDLGFQVS